MPNYNDAQGVADLLSQFDFNIINEGPGDFSTQHRKYTCEFSKPGIESFTTTYQSNPDVHGQPTATDVFAALASDALAVDTNGLDIDDKVFFSGLTHEELTGMVGEQTGEDFTIESVGEPYQVEAHPKSQEPSQPRLAEKAKETRDGSGKLEQDSHDGQTPEREDERADGDAEH